LNVVQGVDDLSLLADRSDAIVDFFSVFGSHEVRNLSSVQQVVQVLDEGLGNDLGVSHNESNFID
jgi:hypothetical protein